LNFSNIFILKFKILGLECTINKSCRISCEC